MNRRNFIELTVGAFSTVIVSSTSALQVLNPKPDQLDDIGSKRGLARKLLMVDHLPSLAMPIYSADNTVVRYDENKNISASLRDENCVNIPLLFKISNQREDKLCLDLLNASIITRNNILTKSLDILGFNKLFSLIEMWDLCVGSIVMHPDVFRRIKKCYSDSDNFEFCNVYHMHQGQKTHTVGNLWTADIYLSDLCKKNEVWAAPDPEYYGVLPIGRDKFGMGVICPERIVRLTIGDMPSK